MSRAHAAGSQESKKAPAPSSQQVRGGDEAQARELPDKGAKPSRKTAAERWPGDVTPGWDVVDEASWESFPASDPPAW